MSKRVTIMIDEDLDKKIRLRQAKLIQHKPNSSNKNKPHTVILKSWMRHLEKFWN